MSGILLQVVPRTDFSFGALTGAVVFTIPISEDIALGTSSEATVLVRVHARNIVAGAEMSILVKTVAPSLEAPNLFFRGATLATAVLASGVAPGTLQVASVSTTQGDMIGVFLSVDMKGFTGNLSATISVDVSLKDSEVANVGR